ncbi:MAG: glycoside hydrolase family 3 C-terminal domain-containing protein, partial [Bacteroidales bacterium]|nr:glycoside hydrolase family 3 C-terminal domain-containing protein [Bacteroidales bacterium]
TFMTAFNEVNGIPASGNEFLLKQVLRKEWEFNGFVVSDWESVRQLVVHGYCQNEKDAAEKAINAGVDMEMASTTYVDHIEELIDEGKLSIKTIDESVRRILRVKFLLGLFDNPYTDTSLYPKPLNQKHKKVAQKLATQSIVLLENKNNILPLSKQIKKVAVIGPLADAPYEQMGTWVFDGDKINSITPLNSIREFLGEDRVKYAPGMEISRTLHKNGFNKALEAAKQSDAVLLFLGEESILSGESHCRADIGLPGVQEYLVKELKKTGKPLIGIILAGRPLTFENIFNDFDALLYAWHPGTMAGTAIKDIIFGIESPSGKLPVTFPRVVGQIPIYYSQKNSGKPATDETWERMNDIPVEAFQLSIGNTNHYLDYGFKPLYPFGFGLSYTTFEYSEIQVSFYKIKLGETIRITAKIKNTGNFKADEVVQLYIRDLVGSRTRPVKELKGFKRINLQPGETKTVEFELHTDDLAFHNQAMEYVTEPGRFKVWIGGSSNADLETEFEVIE